MGHEGFSVTPGTRTEPRKSQIPIRGAGSFVGPQGVEIVYMGGSFGSAKVVGADLLSQMLAVQSSMGHGIVFQGQKNDAGKNRRVGRLQRDVSFRKRVGRESIGMDRESQSVAHGSGDYGV